MSEYNTINSMVLTNTQGPWELPQISISFEDNIISFKQEDGTNDDGTYDVIDMSIEQVKELKSIIDRILESNLVPLV